LQMIANQLHKMPAKLQLTKLEKKASKLVPKRSAKVSANGYFGYREFRKLMKNIPKETRDKFPYSWRDIASTSELTSLINGKNSILDIKSLLDVQYQRKSDLPAVINYIKILKSAGLVEM